MCLRALTPRVGNLYFCASFTKCAHNIIAWTGTGIDPARHPLHPAPPRPSVSWGLGAGSLAFAEPECILSPRCKHECRQAHSTMITPDSKSTPFGTHGTCRVLPGRKGALR